MIEMVFESFVSVNCEIGRNDGEPRARFEAPGLASWFSREAIAKFLSQNVRNQTRESLAEANSFLMHFWREKRPDKKISSHESRKVVAVFFELTFKHVRTVEH